MSAGEQVQDHHNISFERQNQAAIEPSRGKEQHSRLLCAMTHSLRTLRTFIWDSLFLHEVSPSRPPGVGLEVKAVSAYPKLQIS